VMAQLQILALLEQRVLPVSLARRARRVWVGPVRQVSAEARGRLAFKAVREIQESRALLDVED